MVDYQGQAKDTFIISLFTENYTILQGKQLTFEETKAMFDDPDTI